MNPLVDLYTYELPRELIAQRPVYPYHSARLLLVSRTGQQITESIFNNLAEFINPQDLLIFNDSRVIPARLVGTIEPGNSKAELLLLKQINESTWEVLGKPLKKIRAASRLIVTEDLSAQIVDDSSPDKLTIEFRTPRTDIALRQLILSAGSMPIPPYIRKGRGDEQDLTDYQSLFAQHEGSVAAPTASLHFTPDLIKRLVAKGCNYTCLTLHVGSASFLPLYQSGSEELRPPGKERFSVPPEVLAAISECKAAGGRVIAVGTTVVRALESQALNYAGETELFIRPGHEFKICDAFITNFHQPGTTHLALVEAFLGRDLLATSYQYALEHKFRFLSYGDGMLLL